MMETEIRKTQYKTRYQISNYLCAVSEELKGYNIGFKKVKEEKGESSDWIEGVGSEKKKWDLERINIIV